MSYILDEINQAMPPGAVLDVTLETVQNLATALLRAKAHIIELDELYQRAKEYAHSVEHPRIPELSVEYRELRDAVDSASRYRSYSNTHDEIKKAHYQCLLELEIKYFEGMEKIRGSND